MAASPASAVGAHLGGAAAEAPVGGQEVGGDADIGRSGVAHCASMAAMTRISTPGIAPVDRVGHARHRRQGQGPEGGGRDRSSASAPASRTSRRPTTSWTPPSAACRDPKNHKYTPAAGLPELREAVAAKTSADSGYAGVTAGQVARSPTAASTPSTTPSPPCSTRATRSSCPPPTGRPTRRPSALAGGVPGGGADHGGHRLPGHRRRSWRRPGRRGPRCCCSCRPPTRPARSTRPARWPPSAHGPLEHGVWVSPTRSTSTWCTATPRSPPCRSLVPDLADQTHRGQRRGQDLRHDRLAGRVDDRPGRRHRGGGQPPVPRHLQRGQRGPAGRPGRGQRRPDGGRGHAGQRSTGAAAPCSTMLRDIPGVLCLEPEGAFYCLPVLRGRPRAHSVRRPHAGQHARAGRAPPRRGQGGDRAGRGLRRARATPASPTPWPTTTWSRV